MAALAPVFFRGRTAARPSTRTPARSQAGTRQRGATLIEVLVAILIVTLGVLALAGLMASSSRLAKTAEFRATATALASDIADRMRANRPGADLGRYSQSPPTALATAAPAAVACATATACSPEERADADKAEWLRTIYNSLPGGTGYISYTAGSSTIDVWIVWRDPSALSSTDTSDNALINAGQDKRCPPNFSSTDSPTCLFFRVGL